MHLDAEAVERFLHDELDPGHAAEVVRHLESCAECGERVAEARRREARIFALLGALDHDRPAVQSLPVPSPRFATRRAWHRIAAAVALVVGGVGAIYALPGSPLRAWIAALRSPTPVVRPGASPPSGSEAGGETISGLAVRPSGPYEIVFVARQPAGRARIEIVDSPELELRVRGAPVGLESASDRLVVSNTGSRSSYEIRIPSTGPAVGIRLAGRTVLRRVGNRVETDAKRDPAGRWLLDLAPSPP